MQEQAFKNTGLAYRKRLKPQKIKDRQVYHEPGQDDVFPARVHSLEEASLRRRNGLKFFKEGLKFSLLQVYPVKFFRAVGLKLKF